MMAIPTIKVMRKSYKQVKGMGELRKGDVQEAYALGVIPKKEYEKRMREMK